MRNPMEPRPRKPRPTLEKARQEAQQVADEAWAWRRLHDMLHRVVRATLLGIKL